MNRLIRAVVAGLAALPLAVFAATSAAAPASAESNGVGLTPAMGWSSWSFIRSDPTAAKIEAQAQAMKSSGLTSVGYQYVNVDDFWYECPGSQGPNVDQYGRWVIDTTKFPSSGSSNGIQAVANYVHSLGLKFGALRDAGHLQAGRGAEHPDRGHFLHGRPDRRANGRREQLQLRRHGRHRLHQAGRAGVHQLLGESVRVLGRRLRQARRRRRRSTSPTSRPGPTACRQTGRPIHLELSNSLNIDDASTWTQYSNGWRTGGDIECYCGTNGSSYPLTDWDNVSGPVRPGRGLAAVRRARRVQRLRLDRGRQRRPTTA